MSKTISEYGLEVEALPVEKGAREATLRAKLVDLGAAEEAEVHFEYSLDPDFPEEETVATAIQVIDTEDTEFEEHVGYETEYEDLDPETQYYFKVIANGT